MARSDQSTVKMGSSTPNRLSRRRKGQKVPESQLSQDSEDQRNGAGNESLIRKLITEGLWRDSHQELEVVLNKIGNLMFTNDESLKTIRRDAIYRSGGHLAIVQAMKKFPRAKGVQTQGCRALANATWETSDFMEAISAVGGVEVIVSAMKQFPKDEVVQICGCCALRNLTSMKSIAKLVLRSEGLLAAAQAMKAFPNNANIQECGCWTIAHVCLSTENKKYIEKIPCFGLVGNAVDRHHKQAEVLSAARQATERLWGVMHED